LASCEPSIFNGYELLLVRLICPVTVPPAKGSFVESAAEAQLPSPLKKVDDDAVPLPNRAVPTVPEVIRSPE